MAEVLKLEYGKPETVALKFQSGKDTTGRGGPQVMFSMLDTAGQDKVLFLDPEPASEVEHRVQDLGIQTREFFRIVKVKQPRGGVAIHLERIDSSRTTASAPASYGNNAPAPVQQATPATTERAQVNTTADPLPSNVSTRFMAAYAAAIDTLVEARTYAQRKGLALEIRCEDVRCLAATIMIDQKGGAR